MECQVGGLKDMIRLQVVCKLLAVVHPGFIFVELRP
jgi:hypothetical protein